jgi:hypothetical protein
MAAARGQREHLDYIYRIKYTLADALRKKRNRSENLVHQEGRTKSFSDDKNRTVSRQSISATTLVVPRRIL